MRDCECYGDKVRNDAISRSIEGFGQNIEPPSPDKDRRAKREGARSKASRPASRFVRYDKASISCEGA
jgi:hypothetical protein